MSEVNISDLRNGSKVVVDNEPCMVINNEFVKPGKGQAFNRVKIKNLKTGRVVEKTYKSHDAILAADVVDIEAQYLYNDGQLWHFMCKDTFEQYALNSEQLAETKLWLKEQIVCMITLWNKEPIVVTPPIFVNLAVTDTEPDLRGDTSGGGSKSATLETGATIRVPLFIAIGEILKVDTRTGSYVARVKE